MPVEIRIPTPLRRFAGDRSRVEAQGGTVGELLGDLFGTCPEMREHLVDANGELRNFVNVFVNDEDIRHQGGLTTPVRDGDRLAIVPAIAGGAASPADVATLSNDEIQRYARHLIMPEVTIEGQQRLKNGSVLLIGAGGLGSPASLYLAAAGVGRIGIVDFDVVDVTNLQRQIVHDEAHLGKPKLESAKRRLNGLNPHVAIETHEMAFDRDNALDLVARYDVVVDGTDNFATRYLTNDACYLLKKPNVYGSIFRFEGQASVFWPEKGPCYRCLYPEPPPPGLVPSCAEGGVLGVLPGVIGGIQATEALKIIMGIGEPLVGRLLLYDALGMGFQELKLRRNPECPMCGENPTITELQDYQAFCGLGRGEEEEAAATPEEVTAKELAALLEAGKVQLIDVREPHEARICSIEGAQLIPLGSVQSRVGELDPAQAYVVHCKSGVRSAKAIGYLRQKGFKQLSNLKGGILAWATDVDTSMAKY